MSFLDRTLSSLPSISWVSNATLYWLNPRCCVHVCETQTWSTEDILGNSLMIKQKSRAWKTILYFCGLNSKSTSYTVYHTRFPIMATLLIIRRHCIWRVLSSLWYFKWGTVNQHATNLWSGSLFLPRWWKTKNIIGHESLGPIIFCHGFHLWGRKGGPDHRLACDSTHYP